MPRGSAYSRVDWTRQLRRSRSATKARANSIASTGDSLASPQFAISRPCETAKSWRSLPLNAELLSGHGAACSRLSRTGRLRLSEAIEAIDGLLVDTEIARSKYHDLPVPSDFRDSEVRSPLSERA